MIKPILIISILSILMIFTLCAKNENAKINDVSVPIAYDCGYKVVAVDDAPEKRMQGDMITYVPFVVLPPGEHKLTIQKNEFSSQDKISDQVNVKSGKRYRMNVKDGKISLIEEIK